MKQIKTAREMLAKIENDFFSGVNLAEVSLFESDERRAFRLSQVERLLKEKYGNISMAMRLSDLFWTADAGRMQPVKPNPLLLLKEQQSLTVEEIEQLRLILEIAGLCHDLTLHYTFDLKEAFGIRKNDFWASNKQLVEWLTTTTYEQIAMHTAYIMKKHAINVYEGGHYQPAQDALAELFSMEHRELVREPDNTEIPPRDYVKVILDEMLRIDRHWLRGRRLKLRPDLVMLHDEIYGVVPSHFDKGVLNAAQALYDYMDKEVCGRLVLKDYNYNASSWNDQPESVKRTTKEVLGRFAEKVREVRAEYLAEGWVPDNSLEFSYLMSHAEQCGYGRWREEDEAL
ncbi:MAG: hypothetical protein IJV42_03535 [Bacteroidaceae bacterium]|nr:hypothetical protein [Bacteroidaceae bacterium]